MSPEEVEALKIEIENDKKALFQKQIKYLQLTVTAVQFDKPQLDVMMWYLAASNLDKAVAAKEMLESYSKTEGANVELFAHKLARIGIHQ